MSVYPNGLCTQVAVNGKHCMSLLIVIHGFTTTVKLFTTADNWARRFVWKQPLTIFELNQIAFIFECPLQKKTKLNVHNWKWVKSRHWLNSQYYWDNRGNRLYSLFWHEFVAIFSNCWVSSNPHLHCLHCHNYRCCYRHQFRAMNLHVPELNKIYGRIGNAVAHFINECSIRI